MHRSLTGVGNENLVINSDADALAEFFCGASGNENLVAGQNKAPFSDRG